MRRPLICLLLTVAVVGTAGRVHAQADAQAAFKEAMANFKVESFERARDLLLTASQTDRNNPEVFLWLGRAHYQLGEVDKAIAAWRRTLELAPDQPYADRMLKALGSDLRDVETRIKLVAAFLAERQLEPAHRAARLLLNEKVLAPAQRARITLLLAETHLENGHPAPAGELVRKLLVTDPENADPAQTSLLLGWTKLQGSAAGYAEGVTLLNKVIADHPDTPAAATAQLKLAQHNLRLAVTPETTKQLSDWLAAHADHPGARQAREKLFDAYLQLTTQGPVPDLQSELSPTDRTALELIAASDPGPGTRMPLVDKMIAHLQKHYAQQNAARAALAGMEGLVELRLARHQRHEALRSMATYRTQIALADLTKAADQGNLPAGPLPDPLSEIVAVFDQINQEFPAQRTWDAQAALAEQVWQLSGKLPPVTSPAELPAPAMWAVEIAIPVVGSGAGGDVVPKACKVIEHVQAAARGLANTRAAIELGLSLNQRLLEALPPESSDCRKYSFIRAELLSELCHHEFAENRRLGKLDQNEALSDNQKELLKVLSEAAQRSPADSQPAFDELQRHLVPWVTHGHFSVLEQAYNELGPQLTPEVRREVELATVSLRTEAVYREHARRTAAGLTVPRELHPRLAEALVQLYSMQEGVDENDPFLTKIRTAWLGVVTHYRTLEYVDTAETAIKKAPEKPNENAAAYAELQLAHLRFQVAVRELDRLLARHGGKDQIQLTPAFQAAAAAYTKFITDRPDHVLAAEAVRGVFNVARQFEEHAAHAAAVQIYRNFAGVAAKVPSLTVRDPNSTSVAERAAFAVAVALDAEARRLLAKDEERRKPDEEPPQEISAAFAAAIAAYHGFVTDHPRSVLVPQSGDKTMAIALAYVNIQAWQVADAIYAGELEARVGLRHPERLKFCRALCQLGPAIPPHVIQVLAAITTGRTEGSRDGSEAAGEMLGRLGRPAMEPATASESAPADRPGSRPAGTQTAESDPTNPFGGEQIGGGAAGGAGGFFAAPQPNAAAEIASRADRELAQRYAAVSQAVREQQTNRAAQIAMLRDQLAYRAPANQQQAGQQQESQSDDQGQQAIAVAAPVLSDAEIARLEKIFDAAYTAFHEIETEYPHTPIARQARDEILVMVAHWRGLGRFRDSAQLAERFLADHPDDAELPKVRLETARDLLAHASQPVKDEMSKQEKLAEVAKRFTTAREALEKVIAGFPEQKAFVQQAQWDIANSYLTKARVVSGFSGTLGRGQYVRAARQLKLLADDYYDHPKIGQVPQMLFNIAAEMFSRGFFDEAIIVWTDVTVRYPAQPLTDQAARQIAQAYENQLDQPLRAAEIYQELNFALGGGNLELQNAIRNIGVKLKNDRRWVEALHVLETVVDTFPRHPEAGQTLTQIGEIHQANEAWEDAIAAYERAINEYDSGDFVKSAKWSIAECKINLSRWQEAIDAYREFVKAYPEDEQAAAANARIDILKDLASYQKFVDEKGQRKADDAQLQIARIVQAQLANPVKAVIEYRKVAENWPQSHLADDALYKVGTIYLGLDEIEKAREALRTVAKKYPSSSLADDALFLVGKSHEDESQKLATVTRSESLQKAKEVAQRRAYDLSQLNRRRQRDVQSSKIAQLKKAGKADLAENEEAFSAAQAGQFDLANVWNYARQATQEVETLTAAQLADRQDKINAALRKAVAVYEAASKLAGGDKAAEALLRMAKIYDEQLKDADAAVATWSEIVRQFSGTAVAEDASWKIAQYHERSGEHQRAIGAYEAFLRNYRRSPNAGPAQAAVAENYERLGEWIKAMDAYTNYLNNYPDGAFAKKATDRINWIKTYRL